VDQNCLSMEPSQTGGAKGKNETTLYGKTKEDEIHRLTNLSKTRKFCIGGSRGGGIERTSLL